MAAKQDSKWKHFERLTAAIHRVADDGALVKWNEAINGRQFDVTVRFRRGMYDYLTVIECKDHRRAVPVEEVDAFVTKSSDVHAHHAVMASTAGFQSGAIEVAKRHGLTLLHVTESDDVDVSLFRARWTGEALVMLIVRAQVEYSDGRQYPLPEEANALTYFINHCVVEHGSGACSLKEFVDAHSPFFAVGDIDEYKLNTIEFPPNTNIKPPQDDDLQSGRVARLHVEAGLTKARVLTSPMAFESRLLVPDVNVKDVSTGNVARFGRHSLPMGIGTRFIQGEFYQQPSMGFFYYCDSIESKQAILILLESYQNGQLLQAVIQVAVEHSEHYVIVPTDSPAMSRLKRRLERFKSKYWKTRSPF